MSLPACRDPRGRAYIELQGVETGTVDTDTGSGTTPPEATGYATQAALDAEETAREAADATLQGNLDAVEDAAIDADAALDARVDALEAAGPPALDDLSDVDTTTTPPADGDALVWDDAAGLWVPGAVSGGGGGSIAVSDEGTELEAAAASLNFTGAGVTATTDGSGNVTVNVPGGGSSSLPSWLADSPDAPPSSANADDDEFSAGSLDAQWSWRNQGTATATVENDALIITPPSDASLNVRGVEIPLAAGAWKYRCALAHASKRFAETYTTLALVDSVSGRLLTYELGAHSATYYIAVSRYNSVTSFGSSVASDTSLGGSVMHGQQVRYLEIERDGSNNLIWRYSATGIEGTFVDFYTETNTAWLTNGADRILLGAVCLNGSNTSKSIFLWFRKVS